ncbi:MAG: carbon-nitrogen hydrolase family protein [Bacteroidota bacterium]
MSISNSTFKVAVVQATPILFDSYATLELVDAWVEMAQSDGAALVLFPETFLSGYPRGFQFGAVVGSRSEQGRYEWQAYYESAIEVPGPCTEHLSDLARITNMYIAIGVTERKGGSLYCSLLYFSPSAGLIHVHRKMKPTGTERIVWAEGDGRDLQCLRTHLGRIGGLICWENYMPLARMHLYEQQIQLYLAPTADARPTWVASMQHIACEGRCFVLSSNQFMRKADYPAEFQYTLHHLPDPICNGGSVIVSPLGEILAGPLWGEEGLLTAEIDLSATIRAKLDFDAVGHYGFRVTNISSDAS